MYPGQFGNTVTTESIVLGSKAAADMGMTARNATIATQRHARRLRGAMTSAHSAALKLIILSRILTWRVAGGFVGRHAVGTAKPAAKIHIGAATRTKRPGFRARLGAADRTPALRHAPARPLRAWFFPVIGHLDLS
jgi:hypothetical protein